MIACTQESMSLAEAHEWRMLAKQAIAERDRAIDRAEKAEDTLSATRAELDRCLMLAVEERRRAEVMQTPCVWRVEAPAHFVGHMDDKPLEMMIMATSCGKELGVQLTPSYCAYCGHPIEVK